MREWGAPSPPASSINAEALDTLVDALQSASIVEEHCTLMGMMVKKVQSTKSGLNEAYTSVLAGFEVCDIIYFWLFGKGMPVYR